MTMRERHHNCWFNFLRASEVERPVMPKYWLRSRRERAGVAKTQMPMGRVPCQRRVMRLTKPSVWLR